MNTPTQSVDHWSKEELLLTVSIVTFRPDIIELRRTLDSLRHALLEVASNDFLISVVDNSEESFISELLDSGYADLNFRLIRGQGNVGFGSGHNLAFDQLGKFHLVLNPDIQMSPNALKDAIAFLEENLNCGLITPYAEWPNGQRQYLCKRFPSVLDLLLRGFAPAHIRTLFKERLNHYEMQNETQDIVYWGPTIVSGCFMLFRSSVLAKLKGFDDRFFLYFEDFDLSLRVNHISNTVYLPNVKIIHQGGNASKKGFWHIWQFIKSALRFYRIHGLKLF